MRDELRSALESAMVGRLPGLFGIELLHVAEGELEARLELRPEFLAPNGFLHAGTVITLADSCCGMGCLASLPEDAAGFTTLELKANFLRTTEAGALYCRASLSHGGRRTQIWDAVVRRDADDKEIALFRCTQHLLAEADPRTAEQAAKLAPRE